MVSRATERWLNAALPCKLGTVPALVHIDGRSRVAVGRYIRVQEARGGKWSQVYVTEVHPDGHFKANR